MKSLRFAKNVSITMVRLIAGALLGLFVASFLARTLGPEGNGAYALAILFPLMAVAIGGLGLGPATVYFISNGKFPAPEIVAKNTLISLFAATVTVAIGTLLLFVYGQKWFTGVPLSVLILALLITFPLMLFGSLAAAFHGRQDFRQYGFFTLLPQATAAVLFVITLGFVDDKLTAAVSIWGLGYVVALGAIAYRLRNTFRGFFASLQTDSRYLSSVLKYGLISHAGNLVTFLNYRVDIYLLGALAGMHAVGIYAVTVPITEAVWLLANAASTVIFPLVASRQGEVGDKNKTTPFVSRWVFMATVACALIIGGASNQIIAIFFGAAYAEAGRALLWLLPGVALWSVARVLSNDIAGRGRPEINLAISVVALIVNVIANILLIPKFGVIGAAMASSISYGLLTIIVIIVYSRMTQVKIRELLIPEWRDWVILLEVFRGLRTRDSTTTTGSP